MLSKNLISHLNSLKIKKFREEHREFLAEGHKLILEFSNSSFRIKTIFALQEWLAENLDQQRFSGIDLVQVTEAEMHRISGFATPGPVVALVEMPEKETGDSLEFPDNQSLLLALDDIRDPGNFGTIIRIADWFGIPHIYCSHSCVELYNPKVIQSTMGSVTRVKITYHDLQEVLPQYLRQGNGIIYGAALDGIPVYSLGSRKPGILLIGNESRGIDPGLGPFITTKIKIPAFGSPEAGKAESLNASVAAGILCAEFRRQEPL